MKLFTLKLKSKRHPTIYLNEAIPFLLVHAACFLVLWTGVTLLSVEICLSLYLLRMWAITAGYHRYFSHKTFKTSRVFQFILAFLAQSSLQRGVLQWANDHRRHHLYSDLPEDSHSPKAHGLFYAHIGWIFAREEYDRELKLVQDFKKYPELVWLNKYKHLPGVILAIITWLIGGWPGLIVGFFISTVIVFHCTFFINSLTHMIGTQRYFTGDYSRNNLLLAIITFGEGWHNNHHYYPAAVRQGFFWYEIDLTFYILKILSLFRIVWALKNPPREVIYSSENFSPRSLRQSNRYLEEVGFDLQTVINQLDSIKNQFSTELCHQELKEVRNNLKRKLNTVKRFPPKLKSFIRYNLESSIKLLSTVIDQPPNPVAIEKVVDDVLMLVSFQNQGAST